MLKIGKRAPSFRLESDLGGKISLKEFRGKKVVIYFYPKDLTPGCTQQACGFRDLYSKYKKKGIVILGVSRDPIEKHQKFREKNSLPFPLLSDLDGKVCQAYGVWKEKSLYGRKFMGIERTTFIIDEDGKIAKIYAKVKVAKHVQQVLEEASAL